MGADTLKQHTAFQVSPAHISTINDLIIATLIRSGSDVGDTHTGDFELMSIEIHYTVTTS